MLSQKAACKKCLQPAPEAESDVGISFGSEAKCQKSCFLTRRRRGHRGDLQDPGPFCHKERRDSTVKLCWTLRPFVSLPSAMTESVMLAFKMNDSNGDDTELYSAGAAVPTNASISCSYLERSSGTPSIGGIRINPSRFTKNVVGSKEIYSFSSISSKGRRLR